MTLSISSSEKAAKQYRYNIDIVFCIDVTDSMETHIRRVKDFAKEIPKSIVGNFKRVGRFIHNFRVRIITFGDIYADPNPLVSTPFFTLPDEETNFFAHIDGLTVAGGGHDRTNGLEALAEAIRSDWDSGPERARQIIILFTATGAYPLEKLPKPANYPANMPQNLLELNKLWNNMVRKDKRLVLFAPADDPWQEIENWDLAIHHPAHAGEGLNDNDFNRILEALSVGSVAVL